MAHYMRTGPAAASRDAAQGSGIWEVVGILAAVIPCGVFAGLYLATGDGLFLGAFLLFASAALAIVIARNPERFAALKRRFEARAAQIGRGKKDDSTPEARRNPLASAAGAAATLKRSLTVRILKLLGFVAWVLVWGVTASIYADVVENANLMALMVYVAIGALSPIVIYVGLEASVKRLGGHIADRDDS